MICWEREVEVARAAARLAGEIAMRYQDGVTVEVKPDESPVTAADRECERVIASMLSDAFPGDGLLGEEGARQESRNGRRWIIDPIDGTRDYVRGNPLWSTLIGLEQDGVVVAGVVSLPCLGLVYMAAQGFGAWRNDTRIHVSTKSGLREGVVCLNGFNRLQPLSFRGQLLDWLERAWAVRSLGGAPDCMMVASGQADIWIEATAAPWDLAALKIVSEEAGALFRNFDGGCSIYGGNCVAYTPGMETDVVALIGGLGDIPLDRTPVENRRPQTAG